jgi:hypothetical protein
MLAQGWTWREWVALPLADPGGAAVLIGLGFLIWYMIRVIKRRRGEAG